MHEIHWPFGTDATCLAKISPGSPTQPTPQVLAYPGFEIRKVEDHVNPYKGWYRIGQKEFRILSQERHSTGLPFMLFQPDPMDPKRYAERQEQVKLAQQKRAGLDPDSLRAAIEAAARQMLAGMGVKVPDPVKPTEPPASEVKPVAIATETGAVLPEPLASHAADQGMTASDLEEAAKAKKEEPAKEEPGKAEESTGGGKKTRKLRISGGG